MPTATELASQAQPASAPLLHWLGLAVGGVALQLTPVAAAAQKLRVDLSVGSQLTASSNAGLEEDERARADLILDLKPKARITTRGGGLNLDLNLGAVARTYLNGTQSNRLEPDLNLKGRATLVEGWVALDGSWVTEATASDPLTGSASASADIRPDSFRQSKLSLAPRVQREVAPDWDLEAYSANTWNRRDETTGNVADRRTVRSESTAVRMVRRATPTGALAEVRRQRVSSAAGAGNDNVLAIDAVRAGASYRVLPSLTAGALVGQERSVFLNRNDTDNIAGVQAEWQPNERARLRATSEKRFFGRGYDVDLGYRTPFMAVSGTWSRQPGGTSESTWAGLPGNNIAALVDNVLTTRIPNPIERADVVDKVVSDRGLPATLAEAADITASTPQLVRSGALNLVLLGVRHTAAVSVYSRTSRDLRRAGDLTLSTSTTEFRQRGGSMVFSRRLTPTASMGVTLLRGLTEGLGTRAGETLRETRAQADVGIALNSRTRLSAGLGRQLLESNRLGRRSESRASLGLLQNF